MIRREIDVFLTAVIFFTRIPIPAWANYTYQPDYLQQSSRYFPLVGWIVGGVAAIVYWLAALVLPVPLAVLLSTAASILLTGAFHEDGFADVCDGFGGGFTKMRVLEIMKDSRLGTYGTLGLFLMVGSKLVALTQIGYANYVPLLLLAAHPLSRLAATSLIFTHEYVRENEDSKAKPLATGINGRSFLIATLFGLLPLLLLNATAWIALLPIALTTWLMARWFVHRIGGYTGDCLGAVQQATEVTFYVAIVALLTYLPPL